MALQERSTISAGSWVWSIESTICYFQRSTKITTLSERKTGKIKMTHAARVNLRELVKDRSRVLSSLLIGQLCDPKFVELACLSGKFDIVWFDQEHVGLTTPQIEHAARAARAVGIPNFVRLYAQNYADVMRPIEAGSDGIMAAMVRTTAEVENIVRWSRFYPQGMRGINGSGVDGLYGGYASRDAYYQDSNARVFVAIQIETAEALAEVESIARVPGIDMVFVGPADLSQSLGIPGQFDHPRLWEAVDKVATACRAANLPWAALAVGVPMAEQFINRGCTLITHAVDTWAVNAGIAMIGEQWAGVFRKQ
jgi:2-keto-3-deoxy-L-rhamnonate aldolase RhmA